MTPALQEIQALCDAATEGPWGTTFRDADTKIVFYPLTFRDGKDRGIVEEDREFIAQSRTLLPALVARLREAEAEIKWRDSYVRPPGEENSPVSIAAVFQRLRKAERLLDASRGELTWCGGSDDFQIGGKARGGWVDGPAPLIRDIAAFLGDGEEG